MANRLSIIKVGSIPKSGSKFNKKFTNNNDKPPKNPANLK